MQAPIAFRQSFGIWPNHWKWKSHTRNFQILIWIYLIYFFPCVLQDKVKSCLFWPAFFLCLQNMKGQENQEHVGKFASKHSSQVSTTVSVLCVIFHSSMGVLTLAYLLWGWCKGWSWWQQVEEGWWFLVFLSLFRRPLSASGSDPAEGWGRMGPTAAGRQSSHFKLSVQISVIIYIWPNVTCIGLLKVRHFKHWKENKALHDTDLGHRVDEALPQLAGLCARYL